MLESFVKSRFGGCNLAQMAVYLGLFSVASGVVGLLVPTLLSDVVPLPRPAAWGLAWTIWLVSTLAFYILLVRTARTDAESRTTERDLFVVQAGMLVFFGAVALPLWLDGTAAIRDGHRILMFMFDWAAIGFHLAYYALAWGARARIPIRSYLMFLGFLALAWYRGTP